MRAFIVTGGSGGMNSQVMKEPNQRHIDHRAPGVVDVVAVMVGQLIAAGE